MRRRWGNQQPTISILEITWVISLNNSVASQKTIRGKLSHTTASLNSSVRSGFVGAAHPTR